MSRGADLTYDTIVVGAGVTGTVASLACANRGDRVLLLDRGAPPQHARPLGEWIHPSALASLDALGVDLTPPLAYPSGQGYVVFPEDGSDPITLPYSDGRVGMCLDRELLRETLRAHVAKHDTVTVRDRAFVRKIEAQTVTFEERPPGAPTSHLRSVRARRILCATGNQARLTAREQAILLSDTSQAPTQRTAIVTLSDVTLPYEGFAHLFVGGPGPALCYRIGKSRVRLCLDVPLSLPVPRRGGEILATAYGPALPTDLANALHEATAESRPISWHHDRLRPRGELVLPGVALAGGAAGSAPEMTGAGLSLSIGDAIGFARLSRQQYVRDRRRAGRTTETVAIGLAELFRDDAPEATTIRNAVYATWRGSPAERRRAMAYAAGEVTSTVRFARSCLRVLLSGAARVAADGSRRGRSAHARRVGTDMATRVGWMMAGSLGWTRILPTPMKARLEAEHGVVAAQYGTALHASPVAEVVGIPTEGAKSVKNALARGVRALVAAQAPDGSFEGEVVWCPMLAAQYVLACHVMDHQLSENRKRLLLRHFEQTRLPNGTWGLHEHSQPYLFVTVLVYVAARLLGVERDDPLVQHARRFIRAEGGALSVPTWGKVWLALVGLYEWNGVSPIIPELYAAPRWLPVHPSRFYCHTRLIYLGMATLYGGRVTRPATARVRAIRDELYPIPYAELSFDEAREALRPGDVHVPPSIWLRTTYRLLNWFDRVHPERLRKSVLDDLRHRIRYELKSTSHTCISPVSGLLGMIALHSTDPDDTDLALALERFEGWIWEDETDGTRVAGARSATWDTAFAAQALAAVSDSESVRGALERADEFLRSQQIARGIGEEAENFRIDPVGGYCFAGVWHGWPVSDCTAEAMLARLQSPQGKATPAEMTAAAAFVLRCQNPDGGFGSYEAQRGRMQLDWLNPAEMFGACMTERSYVECTASCIAALAEFRRRYPTRLRPEIDRALARAAASLRHAQRPDGSFEGVWGVCFIYGTLFGIRGLLAAGAPPTDPHVRAACGFLKERQRPDGGWGEHRASVTEHRYVEHDQGQIVQTAWALMALVEAGEPDRSVLQKAAAFLAVNERPDGTWPRQEAEGVFFHTAFLEYRLYRSYFPVWALALYDRHVHGVRPGLTEHAAPPSAG